MEPGRWRACGVAEIESRVRADLVDACRDARAMGMPYDALAADLCECISGAASSVRAFVAMHTELYAVDHEALTV